MVVATSVADMTAEQEMTHIRDITVAAEAEAKEGDTFFLITTRYGGGPTLSRRAISIGLTQTDLAIEVYPLRLQLLLTPKGERAVIRISKKHTVGELHKKACHVFSLIPDEVCIWDYYNRTKHILLDNLERTLDDANIQMFQDILVEITADANGSQDGGMHELS